MIFRCFFHRNVTVFCFAMQAWLRNFNNVIWTHYLLCLQHVCYFAETSKNRIAITVFESFSYRFLITFCRGPDLLKINENASQNGASGHPKSEKKQENGTPKKTSTKQHSKSQLSDAKCPKSMKIKLRAPEGVSGQNPIQKQRKIIIF